MQRLRHLTNASPLLAGLVLGLAVAGLYGCAREGGVNASAPIATTPEEAIGVLVQAAGEQYAGLCLQTRSPEDIGKVCSKEIDQQGAIQAHLTGRTFSEFDTWVFVAPRAGGWTVVGTAPLDFHDMTGTIPWP